MGGDGLLKQLISQSGVYTRSLVFFFILGLLGFLGVSYFQSLNAAGPAATNPPVTPTADNAVMLTLGADGNLYQGNNLRLNPDLTKTSTTYRYRYQVINHPTSYIDQLLVTVSLPQAGNEQTIGHRYINNGGATATDSQLIDPQTILFTANGISPAATLAIEFEVPSSFIHQSLLAQYRQAASNLSPALWAVLSIGLPIVTLITLLIVSLNRSKKVRPLGEAVSDLPSRLPPALLGILWRGRLSSRELAATLVDLARRGHLIIRQVSLDDFRFRRHPGSDELADFEQVLLDQIFGPTADRATSEEISFGLAREVFSQRVSEAFVLAYRQMGDLGYFYLNPLRYHRRYQTWGVVLFALGVIGFFVNFFLLPDSRYSLFFWLGMILAAILTVYFARGLPVRTALGDRELARWLAFRQYLMSREPVNFAAHAQEQYLSYLPYAIVFDVEVEWTRRFYDLPFIQPSWYVTANIATVDQFANKLFPLFGYLSHALALSSAPVAR